MFYFSYLMEGKYLNVTKERGPCELINKGGFVAQLASYYKGQW